MSDLPSQISVREVGPRDGLQNEDPVPTAGQDRADRPAVGDRGAPDRGRVVRQAGGDPADGRRRRGLARASTGRPRVRYSALVPNLRGARRALDAGLAEIEAVVSASRDAQPQERAAASTEESLDDIAAIIDEAHQRGVTLPGDRLDGVGLPVRGRRARCERVVRVAGRAVADGADSISFGDTTGMATPGRVRALVGEFRSALPGHAAEPALPQHARHRAGQRAGGARARRRRLRRVGRRPRRLPVRAGRDRQHRDRGTRATWCRTWASIPGSTSTR